MGGSSDDRRKAAKNDRRGRSEGGGGNGDEVTGGCLMGATFLSLRDKRLDVNFLSPDSGEDDFSLLACGGVVGGFGSCSSDANRSEVRLSSFDLDAQRAFEKIAENGDFLSGVLVADKPRKPFDDRLFATAFRDAWLRLSESEFVSVDAAGLLRGSSWDDRPEKTSRSDCTVPFLISRRGSLSACAVLSFLDGSSLAGNLV